MHRARTAFLLAAAALGLGACQVSVDQDSKANARNAADSAGDAIGKASDKAGRAADKAADTAGNLAAAAARTVEKAADSVDAKVHHVDVRVKTDRADSDDAPANASRRK